jgi:hypothetical protein
MKNTLMNYFSRLAPVDVANAVANELIDHANYMVEYLGADPDMYGPYELINDWRLYTVAEAKKAYGLDAISAEALAREISSEFNLCYDINPDYVLAHQG